MMISLVVAASENNAIGKNNQLPWRLPNDMKYFKNITWGMPVVMGRLTYLALNSEPLTGRLNIVISKRKDFKPAGVVTVHNIEDAMFLARQHDYNEVMVIGGGEIFKAMMPKADRIYLTRVHAIFENADTFFPEIEENKWKLISNRDLFSDEKHAYDYSFQVWERK